MVRRSTPEDFYNRLNREPHFGCLIFNGHLSSDGHGKIMYQGRQWLAHRLAWFLYYGKESTEMLCHKCDNAPCCNPLHLYEGDNSSNMKEKFLVGKQYERPQCVRGHLFCTIHPPLGK